MIAVATQAASNPLQQLGKQFQIPGLRALRRHLELPVKLIMPVAPLGKYIMLGLGDIALPGFLVALALRSDKETSLICSSKDSTVNLSIEDGVSASLLGEGIVHDDDVSSTSVKSANLFAFALSGYFIGLFAAFSFSMYMNHAQPALIYLVPGVLVPVVLRAWQKGRLQELWVGLKRTKIDENA
jgi:signal peptide peptidase-like protein 3